MNKLVRASRLLAIAAVAFSVAFLLVPYASADGITYTWEGNNGATGSFSLDSSLFNGTSLDAIAQSNLNTFSISIGGDAFPIGDILPLTTVIFNSTVDPPRFIAGSGFAATNSAGDILFFFEQGTGSGIEVDFAAGGFLDSLGDFVPRTPTATPEPATLTLLGTGLIGVVASRKRKRRVG